MDCSRQAISTAPADQRALATLVGLGLASWLVWLAVTWLSGRFAYGVPGAERPLLAVLGLFAVAFACYMAALRLAVRDTVQRDVLPVIALFALAFRLPLLFSEPIQEIDIYRYLWDGQAVTAGVDPYRYSPQQVLESSADAPLPDDLARLVAVRDSSEAVHAVLSRVHFAELPTVYPPVSQGVFELATLTTPGGADVSLRLTVMKAWLVLFDLLTLWLLVRILRFAGRPVGWSLAYAWCPLVLKEFANSGHLDAIAVCLTTLAVLLALRGLFPIPAGVTGVGVAGVGAQRSPQHAQPGAVPAHRTDLTAALRFLRLMGAAIALALAVGAKLYPVVLIPLLLTAVWKRLGRLPVAAAALLLLLAAAVCWPMLRQPDDVPRSAPDRCTSSPPLPDAPPPVAPQDPGRGLKAFLTHWEMNDFVFLLTVENLKSDGRRNGPRPWFVIVPERWRRGLAQEVEARANLPSERVPFLLARALTGAAFLALALWWAWRGAWADGPSALLEAGFLTLAWFWLLLPTQNPWYWIWAVPLLPLARSRAWLAMSGLAFTYYLRFWFAWHWPDSPVWPTPYTGTLFFDYVVVWIEFAPWLAWLAADAWRLRRSGSPA